MRWVGLFRRCMCIQVEVFLHKVFLRISKLVPLLTHLSKFRKRDFSMKRLGRFSRLISSAIVLTVLLGVLAGSFYLHVSSATHAANPRVIVPHAIKLHPHFKLAGKLPASGGGLFNCQTGGASVRCYGPRQIDEA